MVAGQQRHVDVPHIFAVLAHHPHADPAGRARFAAQQAKGSFVLAGALQNQGIAFSSEPTSISPLKTV
jgi:hypothetical protein